MTLWAAQRPTSTWTPASATVAQIVEWLNTAMYICLALSMLSLITLGSMLVLDRNRGEPVSATSSHVRALQIALGVAIISSSVSLATWLI